MNSGVHNHHDDACQEYVCGPRANCAPHLFMICDPLLIWLANSWLRQISPCWARQRCSQSRPTTCQSLISSQNCNIRDVSLWLQRQGPIQFRLSQQIESLWLFVHADTDSDSSYLSITVFFMSGLHSSFKIRRTKATDCKNQRGLGWILGLSLQMFSAVQRVPDWLELLHFPIGVSEWVNLLSNVIKFADASFFRTGRKRWGFKRLSS